MHLIAVGLSHRTAPVELREKVERLLKEAVEKYGVSITS